MFSNEFINLVIPKLQNKLVESVNSSTKLMRLRFSFYFPLWEKSKPYVVTSMSYFSNFMFLLLINMINSFHLSSFWYWLHT